MAWGFGFRREGCLEFRLYGLGFCALGFRFWVLFVGFRVRCFGF